MPNPFSHTVSTSSRPGLPPVANAVAFLPRPAFMRPDVSPQLSWAGPVVRALFWVGGRVFSLSEAMLNQETRLGRALLWSLGPFSVPIQTSRTIVYDIAGHVVQEFIKDEFQHYVFELAKKEATDYYRATIRQSADGNVSVVFVPEAVPMGDILKWDP